MVSFEVISQTLTPKDFEQPFWFTQEISLLKKIKCLPIKQTKQNQFTFFLQLFLELVFLKKTKKRKKFLTLFCFSRRRPTGSLPAAELCRRRNTKF